MRRGGENIYIEVTVINGVDNGLTLYQPNTSEICCGDCTWFGLRVSGGVVSHYTVIRRDFTNEGHSQIIFTLCSDRVLVRSEVPILVESSEGVQFLCFNIINNNYREGLKDFGDGVHSWFLISTKMTVGTWEGVVLYTYTIWRRRWDEEDMHADEWWVRKHYTVLISTAN